MKGPSSEDVQKWDGKNIPLPTTPDGERAIVAYAIDSHHAKAVGQHFDFRFRDPFTGLVHSFALPGATRMPGTIIKGVFKVDAGHGHVELKNPPVTPSGYGAGTTDLVREGRALVWREKGGNLHVVLDDKSAFAIIDGKKGYIMRRLKDSPNGGDLRVQHIDRPFKMKDMSGDRNLSKVKTIAASGEYWAEVKHDGSLYTLKRDGNGPVRVISHSIKHVDGKPVKMGRGYEGIDKSYNLMHIREATMSQIPPNSEITVEIISLGKGDSASEFSRAAGILNSNPVEAYERQLDGGKLVPKILDVTRWDGKDVSGMKPYEKRMMREQIAHNSDRLIHIPQKAVGEKAILSLHEKETANREGIVLRHREDPNAPIIKVKGQQTFDYKIVGIAPVQPKEGRSRSDSAAGASRNPGSKWMKDGKAQGAGSIIYQTEQGHLGTVGSGLSDQQRVDLWTNPEQYLGPCEQDNNGVWRSTASSPSYVEVKGMSANEQTGIVRAPTVLRLRNDKPSKE